MKIAKKYENINWKQCELELFKLQSEILKAFKNGNTKDVLKAQHTLTRSFAARALAVRKVTINKRKNTYGIDKVVLKTNEMKFKAISSVIEGFFLSVSHNWLLENVTMDKRILREFLKAGHLEDFVLHDRRNTRRNDA